MIVLKHAHIYTGENEFKDGFIRFDNRIKDIGPMGEFTPEIDDDIKDIAGAIIIPGFIDVHCHGGYNYDVWNAKPQEIIKLANLLASNEGVTSWFPTTITQSSKNIEQAMVNIRKAHDKTKVIQGIHLEGPYISRKFKGAQPEQYIRDPDINEFKRWIDASGKLVKLITIAPELSGARKFEDFCILNNIVPSGGHSDATREEMKKSHVAHITHLYNAQRGMRHREPGVAGHALLEENINTEIIADGFHVWPDMIKLAYELKGPHHMELVTDAMRAKGMPEGKYDLGGQTVTVQNGQARIPAGNLAGSVLKFNQAFINIIKFTGCSINDAVQMASVNQAQEFGLESKGTLEIGKDADMNILDGQLNLLNTYSYGQKMKK